MDFSIFLDCLKMSFYQQNVFFKGRITLAVQGFFFFRKEKEKFPDIR
ncbi:hypothetical protein RV10_GL001078 [Enterococcus pallens]|nr:hypothetical protein RV10_GL001078 [Enterococcus pallens]